MEDLNEFVKAIIAPLLIIGFIVYLAVGFCNMSMNPIDWGTGGRTICTFLTLVGTGAWIFRDEL